MGTNVIYMTDELTAVLDGPVLPFLSETVMIIARLEDSSACETT